MADNKPKAGDTITYTGGATIREMTQAQWEEVGVKHDTIRIHKGSETVKVGAKEGELSPAAAAFLLENESGEFRLNENNTPAGNGD